MPEEISSDAKKHLDRISRHSDSLPEKLQRQNISAVDLDKIATLLEKTQTIGWSIGWSYTLARTLAKHPETFNEKTIPHIAPVLNKVAEGGNNPYYLAEETRNLIQSRRPNETNFQKYMELHKVIPKEYTHANVLAHASKVNKKISDHHIIEFQKRLLKEGHFPTSRLVEKMHKIRSKDARKKRKLQASKRRKPRL